MDRPIFSVGHSNLALDAFLARLAAHGIVTLVDVRAFPASRRHPHFAKDALAASLAAHGIAYRWMPALGGRRPAPHTPSRHVAWKVDAFRAYASYMETDEFAAGLAALTAEAARAPTACMCAEALWWRCHRRLIADALTVAGLRVGHIAGTGRPTAHVLPDFARVEDGVLVYDRGVTPDLGLA